MAASKKEMENWGRQEYMRLRGTGLSRREARKQLNVNGEKKFGAVDWAKVIDILAKLLVLFEKFFP